MGVWFIWFISYRGLLGKLKWQRNGGDITFVYYFGSEIQADQPTARLQHSTLSFKGKS